MLECNYESIVRNWCAIMLWTPEVYYRGFGSWRNAYEFLRPHYWKRIRERERVAYFNG